MVGFVGKLRLGSYSIEISVKLKMKFKVDNLFT